MQKYSNYRSSQNGFATKIKLISIAVIIGFMFIAFSLLPKGFSDDLNQIGQGRNIALLAHDHDSVQSLNLMEAIGKIRSDYIGKVVFVVADDNAVKGRAFIQQQKVGSGDLLLFNPGGKRIRVVQGLSEVKALRETLDNSF